MLETSTLENFKCIHNLLRTISKFVLKEAQPNAQATPATVGEADTKDV